MMTEIVAANAALNLIKTAIDLAKSLGKQVGKAAFGETGLKLQATLIELQTEILATQPSLIALKQEEASLRNANSRNQGWQTEALNYEPANIGGSIVYRLRRDVDPPQPPHWLCATCFDKGVKTRLNNNGRAAKTGRDAGITIWNCSTCRSSIHIAYTCKPGNETGTV